MSALACAHCAHPARGYSTVQDSVLCHPDYGLDCYQLVTVYLHPMPCRQCNQAAMLLRGARRIGPDPRTQMQKIRQVLGTRLKPGADPVEVVGELATALRTALHQRDRQASVVRRVHQLWADSQSRAGIVLGDDLGAALYLPEEDSR